MPVDLIASRPHYLDHLLPFWDRLPQRGVAVVSSRETWLHARRLGVDVELCAHPRSMLRGRAGPVLIAGWNDANRVSRRPVVLVEHGAGQTYAGAAGPGRGHECYPGGRGRDRCRLFVCPNEQVAALNADRYPAARTVVVGAPRLEPIRAARAARPPNRRPTVVLAWHWDAGLVAPEARTAIGHYTPALERLADRNPQWRVVGHAHPRQRAACAAVYPQWQVDIEWDCVAALTAADVLVADNTSLLFEAAALDIPVVVLDAPWYRRDVEHGLRFWSHADVGVRIGSPADLDDAIKVAFVNPPDVADRRRRLAGDVFPPAPHWPDLWRAAVTGLL